MLEWFIILAEDKWTCNFDVSWMAQVWYPRICNYDIAPREYRLKVAEKLEKKIELFKNYTSIINFYTNQIENLRKDVLDRFTEKHLQKCFIRYNDKLDQHRGRTTWRKLLPELDTALTKSVG